MKKYEFTGETKNVMRCGKNIVLRRIKAVKDFGCVKVGEEGGWIEKEENLSHSGEAWVSEEACVYGEARVSGGARVNGEARVSGKARVNGEACVCGEACVSGKAEVTEHGHILTAGLTGSRNDTTTFFKDREGEITVKCGCFEGKIEDFIKAVEKTHGDNKYGKTYRALTEAAKLQILG